MSKTKKQITSKENLLKQALVLENEQPYPVPENWIWLKGRGAFKPMTTQKPSGDWFRYIDIDSIDNHRQLVDEPKRIAVDKAPSRASKGIDSGDTLFSLVRPYLRNIAYVDDSLANCIASTGFFVFKPCTFFHSKYLYHLLTSEYVVMGLNAFMKGDNSPSIRKDDVENFPFPVPPLAEQQRIVERIESLFEKLDQARDIIQVALDSFETRKAAILHKAFTGGLTAGWREENGVGMESWGEVKLEDVCETITCGGTLTDKITAEGDIPFLKVYNIVNNSINFNYKQQFIDRHTHETRLKKSKLKPRDVIMNIVGPPLRKIAVIPDDYPEWNMNQAIVRFRALAPLCDRYLYYCLCNPTTLDEVISDTKGVVGQANISVTQSRNLKIPLPTISEQREIIHILDELLDKEQKAKGLCDILDQIDLMKKSILARVFRGELGTNDPSEESAMGLLQDLIMGNTL